MLFVVYAVPLLLLVAFGVSLTLAGLESWRRYRQAQRIPAKPIATVHAVAERPALAELRGRVTGAATRTVPVSGRAAVLWSCRVLGPCSRWDGSRAYEALVGEGGELMLDDGTGLALVDVDGAEVRGPRQVQVGVGALDRTPGGDVVRRHVEARLLAEGLPRPESLVVAWVEPGDVVSVLGRVEETRDPRGDVGGGYRDAPSLLRIAAGPWGGVLVDGDGGRALRRSLRREALLEIGFGTAAAALGVAPFVVGLLVLYR